MNVVSASISTLQLAGGTYRPTIETGASAVPLVTREPPKLVEMSVPSSINKDTPC